MYSKDLNVRIQDFGIKSYATILQKQEKYFNKLLDCKKEGKPAEEHILIGEHYPVITLGRRAEEANILLPKENLSDKGIECFKIGRGGDVTYHCPGQLILYPILDLERHKLGVKDYVNILEETIIRLLSKYGITAERIEGATGVWIGKNTQRERKISAIGIKCSRFCTMHGLSFNVNCDLAGFNYINPCGFTDKGVTSLKKEYSGELNLEKLKEEILHIFLSLIFPFQEVLDFPKQLRGENEVI